MDRFRGFGEVSRRSAFYVDSWHYELEWWSKCSSLERQIAETRASSRFPGALEARARPRRMKSGYSIALAPFCYPASTVTA